jgi:DNA (cytosine-5)-methyltransferase 1
LGLERAGMTVVGQVEIDPFCQQVLAKHWPEVPRHDDVRTAANWWLGEPRPPVDVICGGFPCQPVSQTGRRLAQADHRWLWPAMADVIAALRPVWVIAENVPGLLQLGLADVLGDLARLGYRARPGFISACSMGAPHPRERVFIVAHSGGEGRCPWGDQRPSEGGSPSGPPRHAIASGGAWWANEPRVGRVAYGVPSRLDRVRALGNAVVPQVAQHIGEQLIAALSRTES